MFNKFFASFLFLLFFSTILFAQDNGSSIPPPNGKVKGVVIDFKSKQAVEFATIALYKRKDSTLATGAIANEKGAFELSSLEYGRYFMKINFIGYRQLIIDTIKITPRTTILNIGNFLLHSNTEQLGTIEVSAEKATMELSIDKKTFNVEKSIVSNGGSATDVLQNIPSVSVDIDGNVSLRGSGNVTVLIDGRPSSITGNSRAAILQQIPASSIESIELITNPSAKYDPDGMSGIINIVMKKNKINGFNGGASIGVGTNDKYNASANISYRNKRMNAYANYGFRSNNRNGNGWSTRQNTFSDTSYYLNSTYTSLTKEQSHNIKAGIDFYLDDKNTLGFSVLHNQSKNENTQPWEYNEISENNTLAAAYARDETSTNPPKSTDYNLNFRRTFAKPKQELTFDATYSIGSSNYEDDFAERDYTGKYDYKNSNPLLQLTDTKTDNTVTNLQFDYVQPLKYNMKLEAGGKAILRSIDNKFTSQTLNYSSDKFVNDTALSNIFNYNENIYSVYSTLSGAIKKFGYQLGLRAEEADDVSHLVTKEKDYENKYFNFFPTLHLSQKLNNGNEFGLSYSRRINRPNPQSLNPFKDVSDPYNIRFGNPFLKPEYINSYELSYMKYWEKAVLTATVYYRKTDGVIQRIKTLGDSTISYVTFENLNSSKSYGVELIAKNDLTKWWNTTFSVNLFQTVIDGANVDADLQNNNFSYIIKLMSNMHLWKTMDIQISGNYNGPMASAQGTIQPVPWVDIGIKKEVFRNANLSLNVNDITDSRKFLYDVSSTTFNQQFMRKRESRVATLTFAYRFGKVSENKKQRQKQSGNDSEGGGDMGM